MSTTATETLYTPDDLLRMPDGDRYELVDGQLVERHMGQESSLIGTNVLGLLHFHCRTTAVGWVFANDAGYQCFPDQPNKVRYADVSFIRAERLPVQRIVKGHSRLAPDLAVEVVSPNDLAYEVEEKVKEYHSAGVQLVWVVYPVSRSVHVHRAEGTSTILHADDELTGEDVVAGFRCRVSDFFPLPPPPTGNGPAPST